MSRIMNNNSIIRIMPITKIKKIKIKQRNNNIISLINKKKKIRIKVK